MKKKEFISKLRSKLSGLPKDDLENRLSFYEEAINDRMDSGKSEEEAVAELGDINVIVNTIASETPFFTLVKEQRKLKQKLNLSTILILILGFPLWFPIALSFLVVCVVLYAIAWILDFLPAIISVGSMGYGIVLLIGAIASLVDGELSLLNLGSGIGMLGFGIALIPAGIYAVIGFIKLNCILFIKIKRKLINKEEK